MSDWQVLVLVIVAPLVLSLFSCALIGRQSGRQKLSGYGLPSLSQYLVNLFRVDARALHSQPLLWGGAINTFILFGCHYSSVYCGKRA